MQLWRAENNYLKNIADPKPLNAGLFTSIYI